MLELELHGKFLKYDKELELPYFRQTGGVNTGCVFSLADSCCYVLFFGGVALMLRLQQPPASIS